MQITIRKLKSIGGGCLYKIFSDGKNLQIKLSNTKSIFGVENLYNTKIIKWNINKSELEKIQIIENLMRKEFKNIDIDEIKSKIISKPNYPSMIMTKINKNKTSNDIIKHKSGEITSFEEINKIFLYDVVLIVSNLFLKNEGDKNILHYTLEIESIDKKGLCVT